MTTSFAKRLTGPDLVRTIAVICVICGHFFSVNTPYNEVPFEGVSMFFQGFLKSVFCDIGVPFFILLTGYLCCRKQLDKSYYGGIWRVLIPYWVISVITWLILDSTHSLKSLLLGILGFKVIGYAWYVEMCLGLFLIIPFINIALQECFQKGKYLWILVSVVLLTALPALLNRNDITIVPGFWMMSFPLAFYLLGAGIREYQPHLKWKSIWFLGALLLFAIAPISNWFLYRYLGINTSVSGSYYSLINMVASAIMFMILYDIIEMPKLLSWFIKCIAVVAYEVYLFSYLYDKLIYPFFLGNFFVSQAQFLIWFIPVTGIVFFFSLASAYLYKAGVSLMKFVFNYVRSNYSRRHLPATK